jgi:hypothetical protein
MLVAALADAVLGMMVMTVAAVVVPMFVGSI